MEPVATSEWPGTGVRRDAVVQEDFEELVRACRPRIFRYALASLRDRDAAESVAQDCFVKAFQAWPRFRGECSVQTWLMQIAVNLVRDHQRTRRFQFWKRASVSAVEVGSACDWLADGRITAEQHLAAKQQVEAVWRALADLSERQRTIFLLHFMEEIEPAEIATIIGISYASVRVHLFRAVHAVREKVDRLR